MTRKIRLGIILGGRSGEHEVSLMSSRSVLSVLNPEKYEVVQIGIDHDGNWWSGKDVISAFEKHTTKASTVFFCFQNPVTQPCISEKFSAVKRS